MPSLSSDQLTRYARHLSLPGFGLEGQQKLAESSVLIIGAGGLGSPIALYLSAAGVGHITIADGDCVDLTNLQRQIIHSTADIGRPKAISAAESMPAVHPTVAIEPIARFLSEDEMLRIFPRFDFIIEATDSLETKFIVDRVCHRLQKPYNHGAIFRYEGQTMTIIPGSTRFADLFPDGPEAVSRSKTAGPLGVVPGVLGSLQAAEAIKYLTGSGRLLTDRLLRFDLLTMEFTTIDLR